MMTALSPSDTSSHRPRSFIGTFSGSLGGLLKHGNHDDTNSTNPTPDDNNRPTTPPYKPKFTHYHADASYNKRTGKCNVRSVNAVNVVGWIGTSGKESGTLTFQHIDGGSTGGTRLVEIHYISADGPREVYISVNGGPTQKVKVPKSGQRWSDMRFDCRVEVSGFQPGRNNYVTLSNPHGWAPDIFRIGVEQLPPPPKPTPTATTADPTPAAS